MSATPARISRQNHMRSKANTYSAGLIAEWRARWFLRFHGFRIVASRYVTGRHTGRAEIDIIARRGNLLIFVEVKNRPCIDAAWGSIAGRQSARLRAAANTYLARSGHSGDARFDVIVVVGRKIHWIQGAI